MAFNYSTTWDVDDVISTLEGTSFYNSDTTEIPAVASPKGSKGAKGAKGSSLSGAKPRDYWNLELKEFLVITSLVLISFVIIGTIYAFLKRKSRDQILTQWKSVTGKIFLAAFLIGLCTFFMNSITVSYLIFNLDDITVEERPWLNCFGKIPYLIGRFIIEAFFSLRLHFIFGQSAHPVPKWIIIILISLSFGAFINSAIATMGSRGVYNWFGWDPQVDEGQR